MTTQSTTTNPALEPTLEDLAVETASFLESAKFLQFNELTRAQQIAFALRARVAAPIVAPVVDDGSTHNYEAGFLRTIAEGLRHAIRDHGPITSEWIGSASKRVYSRLRGTKYVK